MDYRISEYISNGITPDTPLGDIESEVLHKLTGDIGFMYFFTSNDTPFHGYLQKRPNMIIGRRGSGKTTFLTATKLQKKHDIFIERKQHRFFRKVSLRISKRITTCHAPITVEEAADICDEILYEYLFTRIKNDNLFKDENVSDITEYFEFDENTENLRSQCDDDTEDQRFEIFEAAQRQALNILEKTKRKVLILLDNIDEVKNTFDETNKIVISGILRSIGRFNVNKSFQIRFCVPEEIYDSYLQHSVNPLRDFRNVISLSWTAKEIISMIAKRLDIGIFALTPNLHKSCNLEIFNNNSFDFVRKFFPEKITSSTNLEEDPLCYILRHTQLLPRQVLSHFNTIFSKAYTEGILESGAVIPSEIIRTAIEEKENEMVVEILIGFQLLYPEASIVLERFLKTAPLKFSYGDLQRTFRQLTCHSIMEQYDHDNFESFLTMLIQTGCIGVVENETNQYVQGLFWYNAKNKLHITNNSFLCLHPIFTKTRPPKEKPFAIYPRGSTVTEEYLP